MRLFHTHTASAALGVAYVGVQDLVNAPAEPVDRRSSCCGLPPIASAAEVESDEDMHEDINLLLQHAPLAEGPHAHHHSGAPAASWASSFAALVPWGACHTVWVPVPTETQQQLQV